MSEKKADPLLPAGQPEDWMQETPFYNKNKSMPSVSEQTSGLIVHLDQFEGPLDVLLVLARTQKVDLSRISLLQLVEQYLHFIDSAHVRQLELAADYLVMAAWLTFLKSKLLLPHGEKDTEPGAEELAVRLQLRLQRLDAMREAGARLMNRSRVGRDVFLRGLPERISVIKRPLFDVGLFDLLKAYGGLALRQNPAAYKIERQPVLSLEEALERLEWMIGRVPDWVRLEEFLPRTRLKNIAETSYYRKSATASLFAAGLELAKAGKAEMKQSMPFAPLFLRPKQADEKPEK